MNSMNNCETCPAHNKANLIKLGLNLTDVDYVITMAGNPNTGKSTVFNNLTGLRQHTGNWPGKTVARAEGGFIYNQKSYKVVDLPGTYSLLSTSADEEVARDFILFGQPDVTVIVVDATRLERNLNLVLQIMELTNRVVLCVNLMDEAKRNRLDVDIRALSKELGVPVIPASAIRKEGMNELLAAIEEVITGKYVCKPRKIKSRSKKLNRYLEVLHDKLSDAFPGHPNLNWVSMRLLEGDNTIIEAIKSGELGKIYNENYQLNRQR